MIVTDPHQPDNPIIFANNAFLRMIGYEREELVGSNARFLQRQETDKETVRDSAKRSLSVASTGLQRRRSQATGHMPARNGAFDARHRERCSVKSCKPCKRARQGW